MFISKSQTGGIKGAVGLAEDTSDASVAVRQTGPIKVKEKFDNGEDALTEKRSVLFKRLHVTRFWDAEHSSFLYLVWTDRLINGSPQNSLSAVVAEPWGSQAPDLSLIQPGTGACPPPRPNLVCAASHHFAAAATSATAASDVSKRNVSVSCN